MDEAKARADAEVCLCLRWRGGGGGGVNEKLTMYVHCAIVFICTSPFDLDLMYM